MTLAAAHPRVDLRIRAAAALAPRLGRLPLAVVLLAPTAVFLAVFTFYPVVAALVQAVTIEGFRSKFLGYGLGNFGRLFADGGFRQALANNAVYLVGSAVPSIVIAVVVGVLLQETTRLGAWLRTAFVFPVMLPLVAAATLFAFVLMPGVGLLDHWLASVKRQPTNWLGDPDLALASIVVLTIWKNAGYYLLFVMAGLQGIPPDLLEAAKIDGAGPFTRFFRITLPLLRPTLSFVAVIATIAAVTQIDHVLILTRGGPSGATNLLLNYIFESAHERHDLGLGAAATVVTVALLLALAAITMRVVDRETPV